MRTIDGSVVASKSELMFFSEKSAHRHAIISAYLSIMAGIVEVTLSVLAGINEKSMSIYGIGIMAFVDIAGSVLVLSLWQCGSPSGMRLISERRREMQYSVCIGAMMIFLGMFLIADSFQRLLHRSTMKESSLGVVDGICGTIFGVSLAAYKYAVGKSLDSPVVIADAVSSFCGGMTSCLALLVVFVDDQIWWSDGTAGFTSALYTFYSGVTTVLVSNAELSKLNRLHRGGPRQAPDAIRRLAKHSSEATSYQDVPLAAASLADPYDGLGDDRDDWRQTSTSQQINNFIFRFIGWGSAASSSSSIGISKSGLTLDESETQNLLPSLGKVASEDFADISSNSSTA